MKAVIYKVKAQLPLTNQQPVDIIVRSVSGLEFAAEGDMPFSVKGMPVTLSCQEQAVLDKLLESNRVDFYVYIDGQLFFWGYAEAPYAYEKTSLGLIYNIQVKPYIVDSTVEIIDSRTGEAYDYRPVHKAVEDILDASGVSARYRSINIPSLEFDTAVVTTIARVTADLADSDLAYDITQPVSGPVTLSGKVYIGVGPRIIEYDPSVVDFNPCAVHNGFKFERLGVSGSAILAHVRKDSIDYVLYTRTVTPNGEWQGVGSYGGVFYLYPEIDILSKNSRWFTYEQAGPDAAILNVEAIGYPCPNPETVKDIGIPDLGGRREHNLATEVLPIGSTTMIIQITPGYAPNVGDYIGFAGAAAEQLGVISELIDRGDAGGGLELLFVRFAQSTTLEHLETDDVFTYLSKDYTTDNPLVGRRESLDVEYVDNDIDGGRYTIASISAITRINFTGTQNPFFTPKRYDDTPFQVTPGYYCFQSTLDPDNLGADRYFSDRPRAFKLKLPARANILPDPSTDWEIYQDKRENDYTAPGRVKLENNSNPITLPDVYGNLVFVGDWVIAEVLDFSKAEPFSKITFSEWAIRLVEQYETRSDYFGDEYELRGEPVLDGSLRGAAIEYVGDFTPVNSQIIIAMKPEDGDEIDLPVDVPQKGMALVLVEGDISDFISAGDRVVASASTSEITDERTYIVSEIQPGYRHGIKPVTDIIEGNDISFANADSSINSVDTVLNGYDLVDGDTIYVRGSTLNDGKYTLNGDPAIHKIIVDEVITDEAASEQIKISTTLNVCPCLTELYSGETTLVSLFNVAEDSDAEVRGRFCDRYLWVEPAALKRSVIYELDVDSYSFSTTYYTRDTNTPELKSEQQDFDRRGKPGIELSEGDDWTQGARYDLEHNDIDESTLRVFRGLTELTVTEAATDIPVPDGQTAFYQKRDGEYSIYVKRGGTIYASYDYYPVAELTSMVGDYVVDSDGWVMDTSFNIIGKAPAGAVGYCEVGDDVYFTTTTGHLCVISTTPPAIAEDFGGELTAISALGGLCRQSLSRFFQYNGIYYFADTSFDNKAVKGISVQAIFSDASLAPVAYEIDGVRAGDNNALSDVIESASVPFITDEYFKYQIATEIFERRRDYKKIRVDTKAVSPHKIIGVFNSGGIRYRIISSTVDKNMAVITAEVIGNVAQLGSKL